MRISTEDKQAIYESVMNALSKTVKGALDKKLNENINNGYYYHITIVDTSDKNNPKQYFIRSPYESVMNNMTHETAFISSVFRYILCGDINDDSSLYPYNKYFILFPFKDKPFHEGSGNVILQNNKQLYINGNCYTARFIEVQYKEYYHHFLNLLKKVIEFCNKHKITKRIDFLNNLENLSKECNIPFDLESVSNSKFAAQVKNGQVDMYGNRIIKH